MLVFVSYREYRAPIFPSKGIKGLYKNVMFGIFWESFGKGFEGLLEGVCRGYIEAKALVMLASSGA